MSAGIPAWRAARRGLAPAVAAVFLAVGLLLAWHFSRLRSTVDELGAPQAIAGWPLAWRPPQQWGQLPPNELGGPAVAGHSGPGGRRVWLLCDDLGGFVPPRLATQWALAEALPRLFGPYRLGLHSQEPALLGPLAASQSIWTLVSEAGTAALVLREAVSPTGQAYALLLQTPDLPQRRDLRLMDALAESVEPTDLELRQQVSGRTWTGGLELAIPQGARVFIPPSPLPVRRLLLVCPPQEAQPWNIEIWLTWLAPGRKPEELVRDRLAAEYLEPDPPWPVQVQKLAGRDAASATVGSGESDGLVKLVYVVSLATSYAAMIEAVGERGAGGDLAQMCRNLAETIRVSPHPALVELGSAGEAGRQIVAQIQAGGLAKRWGTSAQQEWFAIHGRDRSTGFLHSDRRGGAGQANRFEGSQQSFRRFTVAGDVHVYSALSWWCDGGGQSFAMHEEIRRVGPTKRQTLSLVQARPTVQDPVQQTVRDGSREFSARWPAGQNFLPSPSEELAFFAVASDEQARPALFSQAGLRPGGPCTVLVRPVAADLVADASDGPEAFAACIVQRDYDPQPTCYLFDRGGTVVKASYDHDRLIQTRSTRQRIELGFPELQNLLAEPLPQVPDREGR